MLLFYRSSNLQDWLNEDDDSNFTWLGECFLFFRQLNVSESVVFIRIFFVSDLCPCQ